MFFTLFMFFYMCNRNRGGLNVQQQPDMCRVSKSSKLNEFK